MKSVFGDDELSEDQNYTSNLKTFFELCDTSLIDPKQASPLDIARYIARLGKRGTMVVASL